VAEPVASDPFPEFKQTWDVPLTFREEPREVPVLTSHEQVIGLFEHYLLLDGSTVEGFEPGIVWVDLQKVQQLLIWHSLNQSEPEALAQGLLLPLGMELSTVEAHEFPLRKTELARCGFAMDWSGKQSLLIEAIPPFLDETDVVEAVRLILQSEEAFPKLSETVARFAVRRKKSFMLQEALALWRKFKSLNSREAVTWTGTHVIENFFK
jgi:DNA mismatch repair ATPase MutL